MMSASATNIPASLLLLLVTLAFTCCSQPSTVLHSSLGPIQGRRATVRGVEVDAYHGIPYAEPPVGPLRFQHPVKKQPWTEVRQTVQPPNSCFQTVDTAFGRFPGVEMWNANTPMSEDCLYLNVWVPRGFGSAAPRATLVWIYGGGFWSGTSTLDIYDGAVLAATENVVVVSMNYRLGALGFLSTGTEEAPGNQGLMDQAMALQWVRDNVHHFGASPNTITIFGESAGATSVGLHLMSPLTMDLFGRAIMQSASPTVDWGVHSDHQASQRAEKLAALLNCPARGNGSMMRCLQEHHASNITEAMWGVTQHYFDVPFAPVVDRYFLPDHPQHLLDKGQVKDTEVILGVNKDEGIFWLLYAFAEAFPLDNSGRLTRQDFRDVLQRVLHEHEENSRTAIVSAYLNGVSEHAHPSYRDVADDVSGDQLFKCPVVNFASAFAGLEGTRRVFLYSFEERLSSNPWPAWTGVMHGYEVEAVFGLPGSHNYTEGERDLARTVTGYWTRFAQHGFPSSNSSEWPQLTPEGQEYLRLGGQGGVDRGLRQRECRLHDVTPSQASQDSARQRDITPTPIPAIPTTPSSSETAYSLPLFLSAGIIM